jgi:hypothetical protein
VSTILKALSLVDGTTISKEQLERKKHKIKNKCLREMHKVE